MKKQGAFENSPYKKIHGLGMVCRITPDITNRHQNGLHTVKVLLFKGQGNIEIRKYEDIEVFFINGSAYDNKYFWNKFIYRLNILNENSKVLISFQPIVENSI